MKASDIRKAVDTALARHRKFGAGSDYYIGPESALEDALFEMTGELRTVGYINGPATVKSMTKAARRAWPAVRGGATDGAGRKPIPGGKRVNLMLDNETVEKAKAIGGGKLSAGVRSAVAFAFEQKAGEAK